MHTDKRLLTAALVVGFAFGYLFAMLGASRYQLKESGSEGFVFKLDTRSGQTWLVTLGGERPLGKLEQFQ